MIDPLLSPDVTLVPRVGNDVVYTYGDVDRVFPLVSVTKLIVAWSVLVTIERGLISLDDPAGPESPTIRRPLAHASGLPFEGHHPVAIPEKRRVHSNGGLDVLGEVIKIVADVGTAQWVRETVFEPLGMVTVDIPGSPTYTGVVSASDVSLFGVELACSTLLSGPLVALAALSQFPALAGVVPGYEYFNPCPWGLGPEIHGKELLHWTAPSISPHTIGHLG